MTTFIWPYDGDEVSVAGSFNNWERVPLTKGPKGWHTTIDLPNGTYEYKFIIDGRRWCYDILKPNQGAYRNNIITVGGEKGKKGGAPQKSNANAPQKSPAPHKSPAPQEEPADEEELPQKGKGKQQQKKGGDQQQKGKGGEQQKGKGGEQQQKGKGGEQQQKGKGGDHQKGVDPNQSRKLAQAEARRITPFVKSNNVPFCVYDVNCADDISATVQTAELLQENLPDFGVLVFSGDKERFIVAGFVPADKTSTITASELVNEALSVVPGHKAEGNETFAKGVIEANPDKGIFPMKLRDQARTPIFTVLRKKGLLEDNAEDDDEMYFFE